MSSVKESRAELHQTISLELSRALSRLITPCIASVRFESWAISNPRSSFEARHQEKLVSRKLETEIRNELAVSLESSRIHTSLSHSHYLLPSQSKGVGAAIVIGSDHPVGVDLEWKERPVSEKMLQKITKVSERAHGLKVIEFWVIKEASFKTNLNNPGTWISQYQLKTWNSKERSGTVKFQPIAQTSGTRRQSESMRFKVLLVEAQGWQVAFSTSVCAKG